MAANIRGIVVELSGETSGLQKALADVNKKSRDLTTELKAVERGLKLDPRNITLVSQKQKLLSDAVANTKEKLERLKAAQKQVDEQFKRGDIGASEYRAFQREVIKTEKDLEKLDHQLKDTDKRFDGLKRAAGKAGHAVGAAGKAIAKGAVIAGAAIGAGLVVAAKQGMEALQEEQRVMSQTEAVLKSTGKAANVSSEEINALAAELSELSGADDMAIQSGENLLLTFTNIQNKAGEGNDIFNQATVSMLDMSVALGQDMKSSAIQLGKALNDPIKGMAALQRVGVSFTQEQKDQVKAMVAAGDTMGAQKLILAELNKEFGGSAEAMGETLQGRIGKLKEKFEDVTVALAEKLLPVLEKLIKWATDQMPKVIAALDDFKAWFDKHRPEIEAAAASLVDTLKNIWKNVKPIVEWFGKLVIDHPKITGALVAIMIAAKGLNIVLGLINTSLWAIVRNPVVAPILLIGGAIWAAWKAGRALAKHFDGPLKNALASLLGPIALLAANWDSVVRALAWVARKAEDAYNWMLKAAGVKGNFSGGGGKGGGGGGGASFAEGGIMPYTGNAFLHKGEIIVPPDVSRFLSRVGIPVSAPQSNVSASSQVSFNVTVNATPGTDGRQVARDFVDEMTDTGLKKLENRLRPIRQQERLRLGLV